MERKEYKININVLGSNNGQKVHRGTTQITFIAKRSNK